MQPQSRVVTSTEAGATSHRAHAHTSALHAVRSTRLSTAAQLAQGAAARNSLVLPTPLIVGRWRTLLASHSLSSFAAYVTTGLNRGFRIGYNGPRNIFQRAENLTSANLHPTFISEHLSACVADGQTAGPFDIPPFTNFMSSGLGVVPKKNGKLRLIHHLSAPVARSINDGIDKEDYSLHYVTVDDAIEIIMRLGRGCLLAKTDIRNAFRLCPVHPDDYHLLGITWMGHYYYDRVLPFGLRSAPFIFNQVADALQWICLHHFHIGELIHLLDDYLTAGPPASPICQQRLDILLAVCAYLGVPIATEKTEGPTTALTFLGILLDTLRLEARLPPDKHSHLIALLERTIPRRKCTQKELLSLLGKLNFAARVVPPGRTFMRRLFDRAYSVRAAHHHVDISADCRRDLQWWRWLLTNWNGCSFFLQGQWTAAPDLHLFTDAARSHGFGAVYGSHWLTGEWLPAQQNCCITWMELYPIVLACATWGKRWERLRIRFHSDNQAVQAVVRSGTCRCKNVMSLLRSLFYLTAMFSCVVDVEYIPGVSNVVADAISRGHLQVLYQLHPSADRERTQPVAIPTLPGEVAYLQPCSTTACMR